MADRGEHHAEKPAFASGGVRLCEQVVILLAFVGTLDTAMVIVVLPPQVGVARERSEESIVGLGIGVDDATVGRR